MGLMSTQQAADKAGVHVETVRNWIRHGYLKAVRWGRTYAIEERDLKKLLANPPKSGRPRKETRE
jgi:excisionase family DNA binding protein